MELEESATNSFYKHLAALRQAQIVTGTSETHGNLQLKVKSLPPRETEVVMQTQEIPRQEWNSFFDSFSRQHEGWLATLEVIGSDVGAQEEAHELPLEGVSIASEANKSASIVINMGKTPEDHISHTITKPEHVWLEKTDDGADATLEIESADEAKTLLRFRSPVPPEFVDGVVAE